MDKELVEDLTQEEQCNRSQEREALNFHHKRGIISPDFQERIEFCGMEEQCIPHEKTAVSKILLVRKFDGFLK